MNTKEMEQTFSLRISIVMDIMGYSFMAIHTRREAVKRNWARNSHPHEHLYFILCGSFAEGIIPFNTRDLCRQKPILDVFGVTKNIIGADEADLFRNIAGKTLLGMDRGPEALPGHTTLKLVSLNSEFMIHEIGNASKSFGDCYLLSRHTFLLSFRADKTCLSIKRSSEYDEIGKLISFQCFCPSIFRNWRLRNRADWPSEEVIRKVASTEGNLIPSRGGGSANNDVEWRISFTKAEKLISMSLNVIFLKVYVLLRMLFESDKRGVSSYLLKTAVFWVAEKTPSRFLEEEALLTHIVRVLVFLKTCLTNGHVPDYFNPSWNIMSETGISADPAELIEYICCLIEERGRMFLRIDTVSCMLLTLYKHVSMHTTRYDKDRNSKTRLVQNQEYHANEYKLWQNLLISQNLAIETRRQ